MGALLLLQLASPSEQIESVTGQILDYVKLLLVLAGILILAYVTIRFWIPKMMGIKTLHSGPIEVSARFPLEPKKNLYIVKIGSEPFLIGTSEERIHFLTALEAEKLEPFLQHAELESEQGRDFGRLLRRLRRP